jgi:hypothetical protein
MSWKYLRITKISGKEKNGYRGNKKKCQLFTRLKIFKFWGVVQFDLEDSYPANIFPVVVCMK